MVNILRGNSTCFISNIDSISLSEIRNHLSYENINFEHTSKKLKWSSKRLYLLNLKSKSFPSGLLTYVLTFLNKNNIQYQITDKRIKPSHFRVFRFYKNPPPLRNYQVDCLSRLDQYERGTISMPTGLGKTLLAANMIKKLGKVTLFVVPSLNLVKQTTKVFSTYFGKRAVGTLAKKDEKKPVIVANYQSLCKKDKEYFDRFDVMILDECHHCLTGGSLISTDLGVKSIKEIVDSKIKCKVVSYNQREDRYEYKNINNWFSYDYSNELIEIEYEKEYRGRIYIKKIRCTPNHKIYTTNRGYIEAQDLTTDDNIIVDSPLVCPFCNKIFTSLNQYGGHISSHTTPIEKKRKQAQKMINSPNRNNKRARLLNSLSKRGDKNPAKRKEVREKIGKSRRQAFYAQSKEKQLEQVKRFQRAPLQGIRKGPTSLELRLINLKITELKFTGNGSFWLTSNKNTLTQILKLKERER